MKLRDQIDATDRLMTWDDTFCFSCHPGTGCYNSCCRDVTIFLNPLDVCRLRKALGITSTEFLDKHTHKIISSKTGMPAVVLKMNEDEEKTCQFVTDKGCSVYDSRPFSCRLYPLDSEQGVEYKLMVDAEKCKGLNESQEWTVEGWRQEQGLPDYDDLDHDLKDVMRADELWEDKIGDPRMQDMILMVLYDPDRFREFVFNTSFLKKFNIDQDILDKIENDDVSLLYFGGQWLRFALFGKKGFLKIDREYLEKKKREVLAKKGK
jgi:Fe-S-cluster containining protein